MIIYCWACRMGGLIVDGRAVETPAEYVWVGILGAETFLCADHCAQWRERGSGGCKKVMSISAEIDLAIAIRQHEQAVRDANPALTQAEVMQIARVA